ncbi:MAG TPA: hypothetical protein VJ440_08930 [Candidatus Brocadiaceae bacterium]|nr:hypothetical protein [Candidatus Brocadiaceae bacterium]
MKHLESLEITKENAKNVKIQESVETQRKALQDLWGYAIISAKQAGVLIQCIGNSKLCL